MNARTKLRVMMHITRAFVIAIILLLIWSLCYIFAVFFNDLFMNHTWMVLPFTLTVVSIHFGVGYYVIQAWDNWKEKNKYKL